MQQWKRKKPHGCKVHPAKAAWQKHCRTKYFIVESCERVLNAVVICCWIPLK